jgi:hypothetical protein
VCVSSVLRDLLITLIDLQLHFDDHLPIL